MFSHNSEAHLWTNLTMLIILGWLLEFTEGPLFLLGVAIGGGLTGTALHGAFKSASVLGFSGADYAIMWAQLSLLALNWREMPLRWCRLLVCVCLLLGDVIAYATSRQFGTSYESHLFGAFGGIFLALCFGHNVHWLRWEVGLVWLGAVGYSTLVIIGLAGEQYAAAGLASPLVPMLLVRAVRVTRRVCSPPPPAGAPPASAPASDDKWPEAPPTLQQENSRERLTVPQGGEVPAAEPSLRTIIKV
jgi:hypothetical protein